MQSWILIARYSGFWCGMRMLLSVPLLLLLLVILFSGQDAGIFNEANPDLPTWGIIGAVLLFIVLSIVLPLRLAILRNAIWIEGDELCTAGPVRTRIMLNELTGVETCRRWVAPFFYIKSIKLHRTSGKILYFELHCIEEEYEEVAARIRDAIKQNDIVATSS